MNRKIFLLIIIFLIIAAYFYLSRTQPLFNFFPNTLPQKNYSNVSQVLATKFDYLAKNGNSTCSGAFRDSIPSMPDNARLQGSCCSPMSMHRYSEQLEGIKKYANIPEIPQDPYDIEAGLAKKLLAFYEEPLTPDEQKAYDYAMQNSDEKGPCCCKCWRWYVYGGLGKYLIKNYKFTGQQVTEV